MYYHHRELRHVEYGKIGPAPEEAIDVHLARAYRWLGRHCGYAPQVWLSRARSIITGFRPWRPPGQRRDDAILRSLRKAGWQTAQQLVQVTSGRRLRRDFPRVLEKQNIVEAFPNAFLGVCLGQVRYEGMPRLRRGGKFDWLYDQWCDSNLFFRFGKTLRLSGRIAEACQGNKHHEERAALVCLLTAAAVSRGSYSAVGESRGGFIFLPPWRLWDEWARAQLSIQRSRVESVEVWIDGTCFRQADALPRPD